MALRQASRLNLIDEFPHLVGQSFIAGINPEYRGWTIAAGEEGRAWAMSCAAEALLQILGLGDQTPGVES